MSTGFLSLDAETIAHIARMLDEFDQVALSGTCAILRKIVTARPTRKFAAHALAKRAILSAESPRSSTREFDGAIAYGARHLSEYVSVGMPLEECARAWQHDFAFADVYLRIDARAALIERLRMHPETFAGCGFFYALEKTAMSICALSWKTIHDIAQILVRVANEMHNESIRIMFDLLICGCAKYGNAIGTYELLAMRATIEIAREYPIYHGYYLLRLGDTRLCELIAARDDRPDYCGCLLFNAALSGSVAMCEYVCARYLRDAIDIGAMIMGAIRCENVEIFNLAREWTTKYECMDDASGVDQCGLAHDMLKYAVNRGSSKMCKYMRAFMLEMRAKYSAELSYAMHESDILSWRYWYGDTRRQTKFRITRAQWLSYPDYSVLFASAAKYNRYWIAGMIFQWSLDEGSVASVDILERLCQETGQETVSMAIEGRLMRKISDIE